MFLLVLVSWVFSLYFAGKTDWFTNLTPPLHMFIACWFGLGSVVLGLIGLILCLRFLYCSFNDKEMGLSNSRY